MSDFLMFPGSERLHAVYRGDWHDSIVSKSMRIASAPVPFLSEMEDPAFNLSLVDGYSNAALQELAASSPADLPPEIAEIIFGGSKA